MKENAAKLKKFEETEAYRNWIAKSTISESETHFKALELHYCGGKVQDRKIVYWHMPYPQLKFKQYFCPDRISKENYDLPAWDYLI